jgi:amidase
MLDVLAGRRVGDPYWAPELIEPLLSQGEREPGRLRIARFIEPVITDVDVHPSSVEAWERTSAVLAGLGHEVVDVDVPLPREAVATFEVCWAVLTALSTAPEGREHLLRPLTRWLTERGRAVSGPEFGLAIGQIRRYAAQALEALAPYDAVLTPTLARPPALVGELRDDADPARDFENQKAFTPWTSAWNVTGSPSVSLPVHWTPEGLPVGLQAIGPYLEDLTPIRFTAEVAREWGGFVPPPTMR